MSDTFVPTPSPMTCATFTLHIGDVFTATRDGISVALELIEAKAIELKPFDGRVLGKSGYVRRDPFALMFRGSEEHPLQQGLHQFSHATMGEFQINIVPLGPGETGLVYESVFN